jgi:hypothetical protein
MICAHETSGLAPPAHSAPRTQLTHSAIGHQSALSKEDHVFSFQTTSRLKASLDTQATLKWISVLQLPLQRHAPSDEALEFVRAYAPTT